MKPICLGLLISISILFAVGVEVTRASGPIAAYAIVENVILEPNETAPQRIQVWGVFMLETSPGSSSYSSPQKGYLYYRIPSAGTEKETRAVWADLKKLAGTGTTIGFGSGLAPGSTGAGRIRRPTEMPDSPDAFPIGNPAINMNDFAPIANQLKAAIGKK